MTDEGHAHQVQLDTRNDIQHLQAVIYGFLGILVRKVADLTAMGLSEANLSLSRILGCINIRHLTVSGIS